MEPSNNVYILVINGKPEGPFSLGQLKDMGVKYDDFVKTPEMVDYKEAHEMAELRQIFHFSKQPVVPQYFAGLDQRWMASALDWFFISGVYLVVAAVAVLFITDQATRLIIAFSLLALIPLTKIIYHIVMECSVKQATFGKQILRIQVCDLEGKRISPGRSVARNLCKVFSLITVAGYLLSFFNKKQQCLHDVICDTLVMKDRLF